MTPKIMTNFIIKTLYVEDYLVVFIKQMKLNNIQTKKLINYVDSKSNNMT